MASMKVSPKYQVVIPKEIRNRLGIRPGQRISCITKGGIIHLVLDRPLSSLRGYLKGKMTPGPVREKRNRAL